MVTRAAASAMRSQEERVGISCTTVVAADALLLPAAGSLVAELTDTEFVIMVPLGRLALTAATIWIVAVPPAGRIAIVSLIELPMFETVAVPEVTFCDVNVSPAGKTSVTITL